MVKAECLKNKDVFYDNKIMKNEGAIWLYEDRGERVVIKAEKGYITVDIKRKKEKENKFHTITLNFDPQDSRLVIFRGRYNKGKEGYEIEINIGEENLHMNDFLSQIRKGERRARYRNWDLERAAWEGDKWMYKTEGIHIIGLSRSIVFEHTPQLLLKTSIEKGKTKSEVIPFIKEVVEFDTSNGLSLESYQHLGTDLNDGLNVKLEETKLKEFLSQPNVKLGFGVIKPLS